jgi:hypothetical protein
MTTESTVPKYYFIYVYLTAVQFEQPCHRRYKCDSICQYNLIANVKHNYILECVWCKGQELYKKRGKMFIVLWKIQLAERDILGFHGDVASCSLVDIYGRFGEWFIIMETVRSSETSVNI